MRAADFLQARRPDPQRVLTLRVAGRCVALASADVREVVRMPRLTRVPHAPPSLLGLAAVRGAILPVLSLGRLLGREDAPATQMVIFDGGQAVALAVSEVGTVVKRGRGAPQPLNVSELIAEAMPFRNKAVQARVRSAPDPVREPARQLVLLEFSLGDQDFALPLADVVEVRSLPGILEDIADDDPAVIGRAAYRGGYLPLLSLRTLLALPGAADNGNGQVVVARVAGGRVGFVVDTLRPVLRVEEGAIDPMPRALSGDGATASIQAICRVDGGRRLVSVLAVDRLLRQDVAARLHGTAREEDVAPAQREGGEPFLLFRAGGRELGFPVSAVEQVLPVPSRLAPLPNAPGFIQGAIHLGDAVPVIDPAYGSGEASDGGGKLIVARAGSMRAAFRVKDVHEVLRIDPCTVTLVADGVAEAVGREGVLRLLEPRELLAQAQQDLKRNLLGDSAARTAAKA